MFNGQNLVESGDITLALQLLDLGSANRVEAGSYSVTTSNIVGSATGTFQVIIYCKHTYCIVWYRERERERERGGGGESERV